jgi:hypothetical protein
MQQPNPNTSSRRADGARPALAAALFAVLMAIGARAQTPAIPSGPWKSLFNGKDLTGWVSQGNPPWSVQNGVLVTKGGSAKTFLIWPEPLKDYEVEVVYKLTTTNANSGIQVRSHCLDKTKSLPTCGDYEVCGPQLDVADSYSGRLFEECAAFLQFDGQNIDNCRRTLKVGDWTTATARVDGSKIQVWLNKTFCLEYTFTNTEHLNGAVFALQSHPPFDEIDWQSVKLRKLNVAGCTNPKATNYNPEATKDDGSCIVPSGLAARGTRNWEGRVALSGSTVTYAIPYAGPWRLRVVDVGGGVAGRASGYGASEGGIALEKPGIYFAEVDAGGFHTRHRLFRF